MSEVEVSQQLTAKIRAQFERLKRQRVMCEELSKAVQRAAEAAASAIAIQQPQPQPQPEAEQQHEAEQQEQPQPEQEAAKPKIARKGSPSGEDEPSEKRPKAGKGAPATESPPPSATRKRGRPRKSHGAEDTVKKEDEQEKDEKEKEDEKAERLEVKEVKEVALADIEPSDARAAASGALARALRTAGAAERSAWVERVVAAPDGVDLSHLVTKECGVPAELELWLKGENASDAVRALGRLPVTIETLRHYPVGRAIRRACKDERATVSTLAAKVYATWLEMADTQKAEKGEKSDPAAPAVDSAKDKDEKEPSPKKPRLAPPKEPELLESADLDAQLSSAPQPKPGVAPAKPPKRFEQHKTVLLGADSMRRTAPTAAPILPPKRPLLSPDDIRKERMRAKFAGSAVREPGDQPDSDAAVATAVAATGEPAPAAAEAGSVEGAAAAPAPEPSSEMEVDAEAATTSGADEQERGSAGGKKKRVSWAAADRLVSVREFERETPEDEALANAEALVLAAQNAGAPGAAAHVRRATDARQIEAMEERKFMQSRSADAWRQDKAMMESTCTWVRPQLITLPEVAVFARGRNSSEREAQRQRDQSVLSKIFFRDDMVPDSPDEPPASANPPLLHGAIVPLFSWDPPPAVPAPAPVPIVQVIQQPQYAPPPQPQYAPPPQQQAWYPPQQQPPVYAQQLSPRGPPQPQPVYAQQMSPRPQAVYAQQQMSPRGPMPPQNIYAQQHVSPRGPTQMPPQAMYAQQQMSPRGPPPQSVYAQPHVSPRGQQGYPPRNQVPPPQQQYYGGPPPPQQQGYGAPYEQPQPQPQQQQYYSGPPPSQRHQGRYGPPRQQSYGDWGRQQQQVPPPRQQYYSR